MPCVVEGKDGAGGEKARAGRTAMPTPVSATVCGEPEASSAITKSAARWPGAVGLKAIGMVQFELGVSGVLQLLVKLKSEGFAPPRETEEMCSGELPELMTVNV